MKKYLIFMVTVFFAVSCSDSFVDNPPQDKLVVDNFYTTDVQVLSSGAGLYGRPWFYFNDKFLISIGDLYSGNAIGSYSDLVQFENIAMTQGNQFAKEGWDSLFSVIANANTLIYNLDNNAGSNVSPEVIKRVKAEAYFMRATAYFYLVRTWGAVPLLNDINQYISGAPLYRNRVEDVYTFIINDYKMASDNLPIALSGSAEKGRVIKSACDGMLAKVYITLKDYSNARIYAEKVINSDAYGLLPKGQYGKLSNDPNFNNSRESIFALQWVPCITYGTQNTNQAYLAAIPKLTGTGDGWGTFQPSIDLQNAYEPGDLRKHETVMSPNEFYPDLVTKEGGFTVPATGLTSSLGGFRKYVVGSPDENPNVCFMSTGQNTNILRYADILLIQAEAILGGAASTSDAQALKSFNLVRVRAGLSPKTAITADDIFKERRVEFAVEGDYWFDLARRNRTDAIAIISNTERGVYSNTSTLAVSSKKIVPTESDFLLPLPNSDTDLQPSLLEDPIPFKF
jgi:starch-binding outer membrane protein, SusD/RagB family